MSTATIYVRISEDRDDTRLGVTRQEEECRALAERLGWEIREVFTDNDISATTGAKRPGFEELLASKPERIVVWHTDRLVRLTRDLERVIELGVNVHAVSAGHLDLSNPAGRAVARTVTAWATYEGEQKAERQRAAARQRAQAGKPWWPTRPFGFERDGTPRKDEADALARVYERVLAGQSVTGQARWLNEQGFTSPKGNAWTQPTLRQVLINPRNAGLRFYKGEEVGQAAWDAIVSEPTWRATTRLLTKAGKGGGGREGLIVGLARCAECGGPIRQARSLDRRVYTCRGRHCTTHQADWTDELLGALVVATLSDPAWALGDGPDDTEAARAELERLERVEAEAIEDYMAGEITRDQRRTILEGVRGQKERLHTQIGRSMASPLIGVADLAHHWSNVVGQEEKRALVALLFPRIELKRRGRGRRGMRVEDIDIWAAGSDEPLVLKHDKPLPDV